MLVLYMIRHDVIIIGSSYTGLCLASILVNAGIDVALVTNEKLANKAPSKQQYASRLFAINAHAYRLLTQKALSPGFADQLGKCSQPINQIRVVDNNSTDKIDFWPHDIDLDNFGVMIDEVELKKLLLDKVMELAQLRLISLYFDNAFERIIHDDSRKPRQSTAAGRSTISIRLVDGTIMSTMLLVGADGRSSKVRENCGISVIREDYGQTAVVCDIHHPTWDHRGIAVEKFRPSGPFAILPKVGGYNSSLVWTEKTDAALALQVLSMNEVMDILYDILDGYLGEVKVTSEICLYPLSLLIVKMIIANRVALVGDAAHGMHPVAGQGVNLGLRDVSYLAELIIKQCDIGLDPGSVTMLAKYEHERKSDIHLMMGMTNGIVRLFSNDFLLLKTARRSAMNIVDRLNFCKRLFTSYACGKI